MLPLVGLGVQSFDTLHSSLVSVIVDVYAVWFDMTAKKLQSVLIWLVVEFLVVHPYAFGCKPLTQHWQQ